MISKRTAYQYKYYEKHPWARFLASIVGRTRKNGAYGKRGIKNFLTTKQIKEIWIRDNAHLMIKPSIDRIDSDGHYTFENIQFIEWKEHKLKPQGRMGKATPFRGVSFDKSRKRWRVQLKRHQKMYTGGRFKKLEDAIEASKNLWIKISKN